MLIDKLFCQIFNIVQQYGIRIIRMLYIHKVEMIQHRAARFILNKPWHRNERDSIAQMIFELSWPTLQHRRKFTRLTLLFKLLHQHLIIPDYYLPSPLSCLSTRNYNNSKFLHYQPRTNIYKYSFFPRTIPEWNNLQIPNLQNLTLSQFKNMLQAAIVN